MKVSKIIMVSIVLISIMLGIIVYPLLPEKVASHWNINGDVDGYSSRFLGAFLMPIINIGLLLLFLVLPRIDPLKKNIKSFEKTYDSFIIVMMLFMLFIYIATLIWNFGIEFDLSNIIVPAIGILFIYVGFLLHKTKPNWFMGIRTPWTISSSYVWKKTHKLGGIVFQIVGILFIVSTFFAKNLFIWILVVLFAGLIITYIYSYIIYQEHKKSHKIKKE